MKKFYVIPSKAFLELYRDQQPIVIAYNKDHAMSLAKLMFGADNVNKVVPVTERKTDFIDKTALDEYLIENNRIDPNFYLKMCKDLEL